MPAKTRKPRLSLTTIILVVVIAISLIALGITFARAFMSTDLTVASWTGGSSAIVLMIGLGAIGVGGLTAVLLGLAFYSDKKGYDEPPRIEVHPDSD
jgi:hypothetical protein